MTVKQWLDENNICEQPYYHWLKRIRQETYELATTSANTACMKIVRSEIAFAEVGSGIYTEIGAFGGGMISISLKQGENDIELRCRIPGVKIGIIYSVLGITFLIIMHWFSRENWCGKE